MAGILHMNLDRYKEVEDSSRNMPEAFKRKFKAAFGKSLEVLAWSFYGNTPSLSISTQTLINELQKSLKVDFEAMEMPDEYEMALLELPRDFIQTGNI